MKKFIAIVLFPLFLFGNDSEYYTVGNQLVPLESTDIRLDKEVLKIKYNDDSYFDVDVEYTLYNEGEVKNTLIGFESVDELDPTEPKLFFQDKYDDKKLLFAEKKAISKYTSRQRNKNLTNFKVMEEGRQLPVKIANISQVKEDKYTSKFLGWVYYFPLKLKKGKNILHQTYTVVNGESTVYSAYSFTYILSTAKRWKGGVIKDFTLELDMGNNTKFEVYKTFFKSLNHWKVENGKVSDYKDLKVNKDDEYRNSKYIRFYIRSQKAIFHQKNFVPNRSVQISSLYGSENMLADHIFDYRKDILKYTRMRAIAAKNPPSYKILRAYPYAKLGKRFQNKLISNYYKKTPWYKEELKKESILSREDKKFLLDLEKMKIKILRNLPFAKRGYVFKDSTLQSFFQSQKWYKENKKYKDDLSDLTEKELAFRKKCLSKKTVSDRDFFALIK